MTNGTNGLTEFTYTFTMLAHDQPYDEGYCYQFRPAELLPVRIDASTVSVIKNDGHKCDITDNMMIWEMLSKGEKLNKNAQKTLTFRAKVTDTKTTGVIGIPKIECQTSAVEMRSIRSGDTRTIVLSGLTSNNYSLSIFDLTGKVYYTKTDITSGNGKVYVSIDQALPAGVYCGVVKSGRGAVSRFLMQ
jgi:hypothetical protein